MREQVEGCVGAVAVEGEALSAEVRFPAESPVFQGHFPGHPLVPGVFLIEAARTALERALERPLTIVEVGEARFTREVGPDEPVALAVTWVASDGAYEAEAELSVGGEAAAKLRLTLTTEA